MSQFNVVILVLAALLAAVPVARADKPRIAEGERFPIITLPSMDDGSPTSIADYRGQRIVLHVFASW